MIKAARKKKSSLKAIWELPYWLLPPNVLVLYVSQKEKEKKKEKKEWKEENGTPSLKIKQGMILSNQGDFKEGRYLWEWSSQQNLTAAQLKTDPKSSHKTLSAKTRLC